jgi:hypothetical protein
VDARGEIGRHACRYDKVGVIKVESASARNVLVIEPGTSAGGAYFVPLARWIASRAKNWQVWSVERRENLLEDQSELNLAKHGGATATRVFDYYLGWLKDPSITQHLTGIPPSTFAKRWGMSVAVGDLHHVISAARRLGGKVVLGGHSLGGGVVTAYATWASPVTRAPTSSPGWSTSTVAASDTRPPRPPARGWLP